LVEDLSGQSSDDLKEKIREKQIPSIRTDPLSYTFVRQHSSQFFIQ